MHVDLDSAAGRGTLDSGICVIGGGAAGITIARRLVAQGHEVLLLESGGLDYEPATANLNAGRNVGEHYYDLEDARLRLFGGTTAIWGGRIAELDPIDLAPRPWVPHSGWPIGWDALARYYPQARRIFDLPDRAACAGDLARGGVRMPFADSTQLDIGTWDFDRRFNRFQFAACRDLAAHRRCTILTHATATRLNLRPRGHDIESVTVRSLKGHELSIRARVFVLAAAGSRTRACCWLRAAARRAGSAMTKGWWVASSWNIRMHAAAASSVRAPGSCSMRSAGPTTWGGAKWRRC